MNWNSLICATCMLVGGLSLSGEAGPPRMLKNPRPVKAGDSPIAAADGFDGKASEVSRGRLAKLAQMEGTQSAKPVIVKMTDLMNDRWTVTLCDELTAAFVRDEGAREQGRRTTGGPRKPSPRVWRGTEMSGKGGHALLTVSPDEKRVTGSFRVGEGQNMRLFTIAPLDENGEYHVLIEKDWREFGLD